MKRYSLLFVVASLPAFSALSAPTFSDVYRDFKSAVSSNQPEKAVNLSEQVLTLGKDKFGEQSSEFAMLTLSHGNMLLMNERFDAAFEYYEQTEALYEARFDDDSVEYAGMLVTILENLQNYQLDLSTSQKVHQTALLKELLMELSDDDKASKDFAGLYHRAALVAVAKGQIPVMRGTLRQFVDNALTAVVAAYGEDDLRTTETRYVAAMAYHSANRRDKAIASYEQVIAWIDEQTDFSHPYVLSSHAKLVELYEQQGESDRATEHCIAIGSMQPWDPDQEAQPLYRQDPKFPAGVRNQLREGSAELSFDIDPQGFVTNIEVVDVEGGNRFGYSAKKALAK
ncbi:energy transducer TonB [Alteromonas halophila]|uniref:Protein TonB n=1 Tax=Alteromonas halophila TaxID=516698 RepID=A0A918JHM0_9ALTE|nr:energy transducer TonB [Alteromonas halophila]GGW80659.1 cell envelope biogenesis protein TonB [Alteromonas halophila]